MGLSFRKTAETAPLQLTAVKGLVKATAPMAVVVYVCDSITLLDRAGCEKKSNAIFN